MDHPLDLKYLVSDRMIMLFPFIWVACDLPDRPLDEACLFDDLCAGCAERWETEGCPIVPLPLLPEDAPVMWSL